MSVTYGFYNSVDGDRKYDAEDISSMFDGLIIDGVFASIGDAFLVKANTGLTVNVGTGKAWFDHTWTINDAILPIDMPASDSLLSRFDAIVLDIDRSDAVRKNQIIVVQGTPASSPTEPTLISTSKHTQYPLCYIRRHPASTTIAQTDITNAVGSTKTPFVTAMLQTISLDQLVSQWQSTLDIFVEDSQHIMNTFMDDKQTEVNEFISSNRESFTKMYNDILADLESEYATMQEWMNGSKSDFTTWFNEIKGQLSTDQAGNLQNQIDREEVDHILTTGNFISGTKVISDDLKTITSTDSDNRQLIKTFSSDMLTITSVLKSSNGNNIAQLVKTLDSSGRVINYEITYY